MLAWTALLTFLIWTLTSPFGFGRVAARSGIPWWLWILFLLAIVAFAWWALRRDEERARRAARAPAPTAARPSAPTPRETAAPVRRAPGPAPTTAKPASAAPRAETAPAQPAAPVAEKMAAVEEALPVGEAPVAPSAPVQEEVRPVEAAPGAEEAPEAQRPAPVQAPPTPDDLKRIEGVGPKISRILREAGIHTFAQLAAADVDRLREILAQSGMRAPADPSTWPEQAALAAKGDWEGLAALQAQLDRGRRV